MNTYEQYKNTTTERLADGLCGVVDSALINPVGEFQQSLFDIKTANTTGLDMWGRLLGFPRYVDNGELGVLALDDDQYRIVLQIVYMNLTIQPTIPNINYTLQNIFSGLDTEAYVVDEMDMSLITYVFRTRVPAWLLNIFDKYEILPRPMGVGYLVREDVVLYFGFDGQDRGGDDNKVSNFARSIWRDESEGDTESPSTATTTLDNTDEDKE